MTDNRATLRISFTDRNEVQSIRVGDVAFATGGGDLWTAEFAAAGDLSNRIEVRAGEAASFEREEDGAFLRLRWRDIPLGDERGVLNAVVEIETFRTARSAGALPSTTTRLPGRSSRPPSRA